MAATLAHSTSNIKILNHLRRPSHPHHSHPPLSSFLFSPISTTTLTTISSSHRHFIIQSPKIPKLPLFTSLSTYHPARRFPPSLSFLTSKFSTLQNSSLHHADFADDGDEFEEEYEENGDIVEVELEDKREKLVVNTSNSNGKVLRLTVKEKKELASYAHSLGDKLKSQLVGKSGVTPNLASSFNQTLQANELLKIKVHRTCPGELDDVIRQLEELTGSVAVGQIGQTVILYKPSLKKLQVEEKRKLAAKAFARKEIKPKPFYLKKERGQGRPGRGRTGSRSFS